MVILNILNHIFSTNSHLIMSPCVFSLGISPKNVVPEEYAFCQGRFLRLDGDKEYLKNACFLKNNLWG